MKTKNIRYYLALGLIFVSLMACKKLLDEKPDQRLVIPSTLKDFQSLMDNFGFLNGNDPVSAEISADDYYLSDTDLAALSSEPHRRMYTWQKDDLFALSINDWSQVYRSVYYCNTVVEGLEGSSLKRDGTFNSILGQALVHRSKCYLQALGLWGKAYSISSSGDLGIPLRPKSDFNEPSFRATVKEGYEKIVSDLKLAIQLLPQNQISTMRPSKLSAYGLLSRTLLYMGDYRASEKYADSCLTINGTVLDYNKLNPSDRYPFTLFNAEVVFNTSLAPAAIINSSRAKIVPELISKYASNDLRKGLFFLQTGNFYYFKGTYFQPALFMGVATDEMYLTLAECQVRNGNVKLGLQTLNKLLVHRFRAGTFVPLAASDQVTALSIVLDERRKELLMRGLRWMDLKRLNAEGRNIQLARTVNGVQYMLTPNDKRYVLPIPEDVIALSGMPQNER